MGHEREKPAIVVPVREFPVAMNETPSATPPRAPGARPRRWVVPALVAWTLFAGLAAVWLVRSPTGGDLHSPLWFDSDHSAQLPLAERIRVWFQLADVNFRGAYPWILLAPYVVWVAWRFPLERGRWRTGLPVQLLAATLFTATAWALTSQVESRQISVVVMTHQDHPGGPPWLGESNLPPAMTRAFSHVQNLLSPEDEPLSNRFLGAFGPLLKIESAPGTILEVKTENRLILSNGMATREALELSGLPGGQTNSITRQEAKWSAKRRTSPKPFSLFLDLLAYGALAGSAHAVHFYRQLREREQRALQLESHLAKAQLNALHSQLHPHFLFNALNAVATLIRHDPEAALDTLTSFSDLLRLALSQSTKQEVPLREDLRFLERYVEIQQVRLGGRLSFAAEVEPAAMLCAVPALLLQPLVENAIRHGIEPSPQAGEVRLAVWREGERLCFRVTDNGVGLNSAPGHPAGIGLANLRARLELLYSTHQNLELRARPEGGVEARIEIPWRPAGTTTAPSGAA